MKSIFIAVFVVFLLTSVSATSISYVRADDGGSSSDSGSGGDSSSGGSSDSNSGGSSNNGGSSNDNSNNNDNGDKGPPGPSKEDTKDLVSDDKPSPPVACADSCSAPDENGNVHNVPVGEQPTIVDLTHGPIHQCHGLCIPPKPPVNEIVKINIILKIIHKGSHGHSGSSPSQTHGLSDACYVAMKQAWSGSIHVGQNAEIDKFMAGCLV